MIVCACCGITGISERCPVCISAYCSNCGSCGLHHDREECGGEFEAAEPTVETERS